MSTGIEISRGIQLHEKIVVGSIIYHNRMLTLMLKQNSAISIQRCRCVGRW